MGVGEYGVFCLVWVVWQWVVWCIGDFCILLVGFYIVGFYVFEGQVDGVLIWCQFICGMWDEVVDCVIFYDVFVLQ